MWQNPQFPADLVTFTQEILNVKFNFLRSVNSQVISQLTATVCFKQEPSIDRYTILWLKLDVLFFAKTFCKALSRKIFFHLKKKNSTQLLYWRNIFYSRHLDVWATLSFCRKKPSLGFKFLLSQVASFLQPNSSTIKAMQRPCFHHIGWIFELSRVIHCDESWSGNTNCYLPIQFSRKKSFAIIRKVFLKWFLITNCNWNNKSRFWSLSLYMNRVSCF